MTTHELRRRMHAQRRTERERLLQHGRGERVVDHDGHVARGAHDGRDVDEVERRVAGRLEDDQARVGLDRVGDLVDARPRHPRAEQASGEQVIGAAIQRADGDDVRGARRDGRE